MTKENVVHSKFNILAELTPAKEFPILAGLITDFALYRDSLSWSQYNNQLTTTDLQDILIYLGTTWFIGISLFCYCHCMVVSLCAIRATVVYTTRKKFRLFNILSFFA